MARDSRKRYQSYRKREAGGRGRKFLAKLTFFATLVVLISGLGFFFYEALGQSEFFQIVDITVEGCQRLSKKEIIELSGVDVHSNLVKMSSSQVKKLLEERTE